MAYQAVRSRTKYKQGDCDFFTVPFFQDFPAGAKGLIGPCIAGTAGLKKRNAFSFFMIIVKTLKAGGTGIFKPFSLAESLLTGGIAAAVSGFGHEKPKGVRTGFRKWPHVDPEHGRGKNGAAKNFGVGLKIGGGYAASHGMTIEEQGKGVGRGDHNLCHKIVKRPCVALKMIDMDHAGMVGIAEGTAMPRVIGKVNLIP